MERRTRRGWWLSVCSALLLACGGEPDAPDAAEAGAQEQALQADVAVYADALGAGWRDASSARRSLRNRSPVASGRRSISVTFSPGAVLAFEHAPLATAAEDALEFMAHGGTTQGPALAVAARVGGMLRPAVAAAAYCDGGRIPAGAWTRCRVPMSALGAGAGGLDGLRFTETSGASRPAMYLDAMRLVAAPLAAPAAPASLAASASTGAVQLTWSAASGATGYHVYRATAQGGAFSRLTSTAQAALTYADAAVSAGATYWYAVTAVNAGGESAQSPQASATVPDAPPPAGQWVSAYYVGYQKDLYPPERVDFSAITHLIVGRITPNTDGTVDTLFDTDNGEAMARTLSTRAHAAGRKALLMVGGAGEYQNWVGAASSANRSRFVTNLLAAMDRLGYDGLDIDWEPVETADEPNLLALVQALRAARPNMLLTFPIYWVNANFDEADPWYAQLAQHLDQVNIMSYEMVGPWDGWTSWHTSALTGHTGTHPTSVSSSLAGWASVGIPKAKLGMGIGFYGQAWRNISGPNQAFTSWSDFKASDNYVTYAYILRHYTDAAYRWDASAQAGYLTFSTPVDGDVRFISYESPQAILAKGAFSRANGYGGTIIWTVNQGCIDASTGQNPPLDAVRQGFLQ